VPPTTDKPGILFTAFEPSGDALAAAAIHRLRQLLPETPIYAWGGPKCEKAGAELIEQTCGDAAMILPGLKVIGHHIAIGKRVRRFVREHDLAVHVPVDSPAANFPLCKTTRRAGCKVVHLAAPQLWAWAEGRIRKLRRRTDHVLCLLPFEEQWFRERHVPATFIGHPLFDKPFEDLDPNGVGLPPGTPRLALLPGSRMAEVNNNFPLMVRTFAEMQSRFPSLAAVAVAATEPIAERLHDLTDDVTRNLYIARGRIDEALAWSDLVLVTSGTATIQVARARRPMIVTYKMRFGPMWFVFRVLGPMLMTTKHFALPNVLAGEVVVPEFAPHFGGHEPIAKMTQQMLDDTRLGADQVERLSPVLKPFEDRHASKHAAAMIAKIYAERTKAKPTSR
jgi:lipid-A-disaccharide synthase